LVLEEDGRRGVAIAFGGGVFSRAKSVLKWTIHELFPDPKIAFGMSPSGIFFACENPILE